MFYNQTLKAIDVISQSAQHDTDLLDELHYDQARIWEYVHFAVRVDDNSASMRPGATWLRRTGYVIDSFLGIAEEIEGAGYVEENHG